MSDQSMLDGLGRLATNIESSGSDLSELKVETPGNPPKELQTLDWDGPDDPGNPLNWSTAKKALHIYVASILGMAATVGVSSYSPAIDDVAKHFHVSRVAAIVPLTLYILGQAFGSTIAAPISETFGRKGVFLVTSPIGLLFAMGSGFSQNYGSLCTLHFFAGVFSSPALSVGGGIVADTLLPIHRSVGTALWVVFSLSGTALGSAFAGFPVQEKGWRWSQWVFVFMTLTGWIPSLFTSESYKKIILKRRARSRKQNQSLNQDETTSPPVATTIISRDLHELKSSVGFFLTVTLLRPCAMMVYEPIVSSFAIYLAVIFSIYFSFFEAFPIVFSGVYKFNLGEMGLSFNGIFIGLIIGLVIHIFLDRLTYQNKIRTQQAKGDFSGLPPEDRLYPAMVGAPLVPIGLFWFAWSSRIEVHWMSSEIATVFFGIGAVGLCVPSLQYLLDVYGPLFGASAIGANNLLRYGVGAVSPLYTRQMYGALGINWAVSLLAFVTLALVPVPFVLYKYGESIRARSRYKPAGIVKK